MLFCKEECPPHAFHCFASAGTSAEDLSVEDTERVAPIDIEAPSMSRHDSNMLFPKRVSQCAAQKSTLHNFPHDGYLLKATDEGEDSLSAEGFFHKALVLVNGQCDVLEEICQGVDIVALLSSCMQNMKLRTQLSSQCPCCEVPPIPCRFPMPCLVAGHQHG